MNELDLIIDLHKDAERQGPGSPEETLKALGLIGISKKAGLRIADIGSGSGGQTITIAQNIHGEITAVDLFDVLLSELNQRLKKFKVQEKVKTLKASMEDLPFDKNYFDIIWSEGAIYNMGFEKGIKKWKDFLNPGGYLSISEITWLTNARPQKLEDFWNSEYPEIDMASNKIKILEQNGYTLVGYFYLSQDSWLKNYYQPLQSRFDSFLKRHNNSELAVSVVRQHEEEIELYEKYKDYYSYGFYIARKNEKKANIDQHT